MQIINKKKYEKEKKLNEYLEFLSPCPDVWFASNKLINSDISAKEIVPIFFIIWIKLQVEGEHLR